VTEADRNLLAMVDAKMSVQSIASILGVGAPGLQRRIDRLIAARAAPAPGAVIIDFPAPEAGTEFAVSVTDPEEPRSASSGAWSQVWDRVDPPAGAREPYNPVTPRKLRYCRWFLDAGWTVRSVAALFDVTATDLREALG
jgi:hypothetical protein